MRKSFMKTLVAAGTAALLAGGAAPALASTSFSVPTSFSTPTSFGAPITGQAVTGAEEAANNRRDRRYRDRQRYRDNRYYGRQAYAEPLRSNSRVWRGRDGRYHCQKKDGTTGLIIGGAVGALLGREIDGGRDRTLGTILGAAGGGLLGREVDRGGSRCR